MSYPTKYSRKKKVWMVRVGANRWRRASLRKCWNCSQEFYAPVSQAASFCSQTCSGQYRSKLYSQGQPKKPCLICGELFSIKRSHFDRYKTCGSEECHKAIRIRNGIRRWSKEAIKLPERS